MRRRSSRNSETRRRFSTDAQRWNAVEARDRAAEGAFVYAVKTTGVYCRPGCGSRSPHRENVRFFALWQEAERAGFRACRRCRPREVRAAVPAAVVQAVRLIDEAGKPPALPALARAVGLSPHYFHRLFKRHVGVTPKAYAASKRIGRLQDGLARGRPVARAVYEAGFGSGSRCYETADDALGMSPGRYRRGGAGVRIRWAIVRSHLGWLLVAATGRGVCRIEFGDRKRELRKRLTARFPQAELVDGDAEFATWVSAVTEALASPRRGLSLPLDIQGTAFQHRVWNALRAIPAGATATYSEIARRIGRPSAVRAVARACAANPVAVAVPCHRVIGSNGDLTGYRWGIERKRSLLEREAEQAGKKRPDGEG